MSFEKGAVVIDLDHDRGWERSDLPNHIKLAPLFFMDFARVADLSLTTQLQDAVAGIEPFSARVTKYSEYRDVENRPEFLRLHRQSMAVIASLASNVGPMDKMGDAYVPVISRGELDLDDDEVSITGISVAFEIGKSKWRKLPHSIVLGGHND